MKIGIIGLGAIGTDVAVAAKKMPEITELHVYDVDPDAISSLPVAANVLENADQVVAASDLVIECANKAVVQNAIVKALAQGKSGMILTVGALADDTLRQQLSELAIKHGGRVYVPSGAVMGLDGLRAAKEAEITSVTLVTTKPPQGLDSTVDKWTLLFNGPAREAVQKFPKNVNVAAALSLAGLGVDDTWVQVAVDPLATRNSHKVIIDGAFGRARIEVENLPSPSNPRTSHLASLSAIALLRRLVSPIQVGT